MGSLPKLPLRPDYLDKEYSFREIGATHVIQAAVRAWLSRVRLQHMFKLYAHRTKVVEELISTETTYVRGLQHIVNVRLCIPLSVLHLQHVSTHCRACSRFRSLS